MNSWRGFSVVTKGNKAPLLIGTPFAFVGGVASFHCEQKNSLLELRFWSRTTFLLTMNSFKHIEELNISY